MGRRSLLYIPHERELNAHDACIGMVSWQDALGRNGRIGLEIITNVTCHLEERVVQRKWLVSRAAGLRDAVVDGLDSFPRVELQLTRATP